MLRQYVVAKALEGEPDGQTDQVFFAVKTADLTLASPLRIFLVLFRGVVSGSMLSKTIALWTIHA